MLQRHAQSFGLQAKCSTRRGARMPVFGTARSDRTCHCNATQGAAGGAELPCGRRATLLGLSAGVALLTADAFYLHTPNVLAAGPRYLPEDAQKAVDQAIAKAVPKGKAPVILRLAYHDAGTFSKIVGDGGLNASIQYELDRPENFGLKRGWNVITQIMASLKKTPAAGLVSYADLIAMAGAHAVAITGGPKIRVPIGRVDAAAADPPGRMASEMSSADVLKQNFSEKGFNVREMVALSGAHTIGGKGFGDAATFDNAYYTALLKKPWLNTADEMSTHIGLPSDHVLPDDLECKPIIEEFAKDQPAFHREFADAYVKMTTLGARWV